MKKKIKIFLIVLMILVVLIVVAIITINKLKSTYRTFYKVSDNQVLDESYNTTFKKINIESNLSDINIKKSTDNTTRVVINGDKDFVNVNIKDNEIFIEIEDRNCIGFCLKATIANVEIYLPESYSNLVEIENEYGNIVIDNFSETDFDIDSDYGNINILSSDFIKIDIDHGNLTLSNSIMARINSLNGNIGVGEVNNIEIESEYGDINIKRVNEYLKLINDTGDIKIDNINLIKDSFIQNNYGDINIGGTNEIYINTNTDLGAIEIKNNFKESKIILKIENNSGNIVVNNG